MSNHSKFGGSIIDVISHCPGYVNANKNFPNETNGAAEKGTAYHECAEYCERLGFNAEDAYGLYFNGYECDEDMVDAVQIYLNHIRSIRAKHPDLKVWIEGKVTLSSVADDVFGYADFMAYSPVDRVLYTSDLKGGFVLVDVEKLQTPYYSIGGLDTYGLWFAVDKIVCTIVQPRAQHSEGLIRSRTYAKDVIYEKRDVIVETVRKARDPDAERIAGSHCTYCSAAATCRKRMERTVFLATLLGTKVDLTNDEIAEILIEIPTIKKNLDRVKEYADQLARGGSSFKNFKLVKPITRAKCEDEKKFIAGVKELLPNVTNDDLFNPGRLKGKTVLMQTLRKGLRDTDAKAIADLINANFVTGEGLAELVTLDNPRQAVNNDASGIFAPIEEI